MFKKSLAVFLTIAMSLSLAACGAKSDPAPKETASTEVTSNEVVAEVADKVEQPETKTEEPAVQEEPKTDGAPVQPTSRVAHMVYGSIDRGDLQESLSYNADGSYVVSGRSDNPKGIDGAVSFDYEYSVNNTGEITNLTQTYYASYAPDGAKYTIDMVKGYPLQLKTDAKGNTNSQSGQFVTDFGLVLQIKDNVSDGNLVTDGSGNISVCDTQNLSWSLYEGVNGILDAGIPGMNYQLEKNINNNEAKNISFSTDKKDNKLFLIKTFQTEGYNATTRSNEMITTYGYIDVITYNSLGLVESIESYKDGLSQGLSPENLDSKFLDGFTRYTYDSQGNVTQMNCRPSSGTVETKITYSYGNETSATESVSSSDSTSDLASVIVGTWKDKTGLNDVSFEFYEDGTGRENLGGAILFDYTVNGDEVTLVMRAGKIPNSVMKYQDGKLVAGDMKVEKIN